MVSGNAVRSADGGQAGLLIGGRRRWFQQNGVWATGDAVQRNETEAAMTLQV